MEHILDPREVSHPQLREFALSAALVAKLDETFEELQSLCAIFDTEELEAWSVVHERDRGYQEAREKAAASGDLTALGPDWTWINEGEPEDPEVDLWRELPQAVATWLVESRLAEESDNLESRVAAWLAEDDANWQSFRDLIILPWQMRPGACHSDTPRWVVVLGALPVVESYGQVPYDPRPWVAIGQLHQCGDGSD